ncbi:MAG TPA: outer membrane lipoprotein carrier protein LolA, partial [Cytophagaceae bacterium]|nr:outer membrane lipoprotein carrier protein LolA [Cytophagaceae bacterium]
MRKINTYLLSVLMVCLVSSVKAQTVEKYVLVSNAQEAKQIFDQIKQASNTIEADFVQEKKVDILENIITSKGKFLFKQKNSLRLEYTSPSYYLVVMATGKMLIKDGDKKTKIDGKGSKMFAQIQNVMAGILGGQINDNKDFKYELYKGENNYRVRLFPQTGAIKDLLKEVEFITNRTTLKAISMTMFERSGDVTVMKFKNVKMN